MPPVITLIALDQGVSGVAMDLDAVVAITATDLVVQKLGSIGMAVHVFGKHELVMVSIIAIPCIVDVRILHCDTR